MPSSNHAKHFVAVYHTGSSWYYYWNETAKSFTPHDSDVLVAEVDYSNDQVTSLEGTDSIVEGVRAGYTSGDLVVTADEWGGSFNNGEFGLSGSFFRVSDDNTFDVGELGRGILAADYANGTGYIMYSHEDVNIRLGSQPSAYQADHFLSVYHDGTSWYYHRNDTSIAFTPTATDVLIAEVDYSNNTVQSLEGFDFVVEEIRAGYESGDVVVIADQWDGAYNNGEFGITGTYFTLQNGQFQAAQAQARYDWVVEVGGDYSDLIASQFDNKIHRSSDAIAAGFAYDIAVHNAQTTFEAARNVDQRNHSAAWGNASTQSQVDLSNIAALRATDGTAAENARLQALVVAKSVYATALAIANKTYRLSIHDGVDETVAYDQLVSDRADALYEYEVDIAEATYALQTLWTEIKQEYEEAAAANLAGLRDDAITLEKDFELAVAPDFKTFASTTAIAEVQFDADIVSAMLDEQYNNAVAESALKTADFAARASITANVELATGPGVSWSEFAADKNGAQQTWWATYGSNLVQRYADDRTDSNQAYADRVSAISTSVNNKLDAEAAFHSAFWNAQVSKTTAFNSNENSFVDQLSPAAKTYLDSVAIADRDYEFAMAAAKRNLTQGTDGTNSYDQTAYDTGIETAKNVRDAAVEVARRLYAIAHANETVAHDNANAQEDIAFVDSVTAADVTQVAAIQAEQVALSSALSIHQQSLADNIAENEADDSVLKATSYHAALVAGFGASPSARQQLEIDLAAAEVARATGNAAATETMESERAQYENTRLNGQTTTDRDQIVAAANNRRTTALGYANAEASRLAAAGIALQNLAADGQHDPETPVSAIMGPSYLPEVSETIVPDYFKSLPTITDYTEEMFQRQSLDPDDTNGALDENFGTDRSHGDNLRAGLIRDEGPEDAVDPYSNNATAETDTDTLTVPAGESGESGRQIEFGEVPGYIVGFAGTFGDTDVEDSQHRGVVVQSSWSAPIDPGDVTGTTSTSFVGFGTNSNAMKQEEEKKQQEELLPPETALDEGYSEEMLQAAPSYTEIRMPAGGGDGIVSSQDMTNGKGDVAPQLSVLQRKRSAEARIRSNLNRAWTAEETQQYYIGLAQGFFVDGAVGDLEAIRDIAEFGYDIVKNRNTYFNVIKTVFIAGLAGLQEEAQKAVSYGAAFYHMSPEARAAVIAQTYQEISDDVNEKHEMFQRFMFVP